MSGFSIFWPSFSDLFHYVLLRETYWQILHGNLSLMTTLASSLDFSDLTSTLCLLQFLFAFGVIRQ